MDREKISIAVRNYIEKQPKGTQEALMELRTLILRAAPDAEETMNYAIPAYGLVPGGKRDRQVMMAGYKKHVGFYPHPAVMEHFAGELGEYKKGKGSVQFPLDKPLPADLIMRMVRFRRDMLREVSQ